MKQKIYTLYGLWMKRTILASSLIFTILFSANAQTQLVQWNFSNFSNTPTANLPQNAGKLVTAVGQSQAAFISAAGTLYDPPYIVNGWNQPGDAYFLMNFSTLGYVNNTITYYLGAFEFGAKSFQPQFSVVSDIGPWLDFGTAVTFPPAGGATMFTNEMLPALADNQPNVWVRMLSTSAPIGNGGDYIDEIEVLGTPMFPLPVSIVDFSVKTENNQNLLSWTTASENNSSQFELQHAVNPDEFSTMGTIPTKAIDGNSHATLSYSYADVNPAAGHNYYRLKHVDKDGSAQYSKVVDIVNVHTEGPVKVYPNPAMDVLNIDLYAENEYPMIITFTDVLGKEVKRGTCAVTAGNNHIVTDMKGLQSGIYTMRLFNGKSMIYTQKVRGY